MRGWMKNVRRSSGSSRHYALPEYPEAVLREAVVNALAHRDDGLQGATVDIIVWDDRIEVRSPGPLPGHITIDNMRDEHYSRNPRIMRVLKTMGLSKSTVRASIACTGRWSLACWSRQPSKPAQAP